MPLALVSPTNAASKKSIQKRAPAGLAGEVDRAWGHARPCVANWRPHFGRRHAVRCHIFCSKAISEHGSHGVDVEVHVDGGIAIDCACNIIRVGARGNAATLDLLTGGTLRLPVEPREAVLAFQAPTSPSLTSLPAPRVKPSTSSGRLNENCVFVGDKPEVGNGVTVTGSVILTSNRAFSSSAWV